jgi:hypothetical protein
MPHVCPFRQHSQSTTSGQQLTASITCVEDPTTGAGFVCQKPQAPTLAFDGSSGVDRVMSPGIKHQPDVAHWEIARITHPSSSIRVTICQRSFDPIFLYRQGEA